MRKLFVRNLLPDSLSSVLWGNRKKWGLTAWRDDPCWQEWSRTYLEFYSANQRAGVGTLVNEAGYRIMSRIEMAGKTVLEIGPGDIRHIAYWRGGHPGRYILADVQQEMLDKGAQKLSNAGVSSSSMLMERDSAALPIPDGTIDIIVSFYSLEHIYPLAPYLAELHRVLRAGGVLVGAIPAEGGLAWGGGRYLTSRRWMKRNTTIDPDKIICWEHPNFADEILAELNNRFLRLHTSYWPFPFLPLLDINLIIRFIYEKRNSAC